MPPQWPDDLTLNCDVPPMFNQDGADKVTPVARVTRAGIVASVEFIPAWNLTGVNTNSRTFTLYNRGSAGAGTTAIATLAMTSGTNLSKFVPATITLGAGANRTLAVGDILEWESLHVGNGIADPGGRLIVQQSYAP